MCKFICYIFCLSGRAVICIVYLADFWNVQIYLLHFLFIREGSYLYRLLSRRYYRRIAHLRIGDGPLPIRSASSGVLFVGPLPIQSASSSVLFVGCCLSGVRAPAYCLLPAAYPECELRRIVCWLLPIRSASSGVLFVGC